MESYGEILDRYEGYTVWKAEELFQYLSAKYSLWQVKDFWSLLYHLQELSPSLFQEMREKVTRRTSEFSQALNRRHYGVCKKILREFADARHHNPRRLEQRMMLIQGLETGEIDPERYLCLFQEVMKDFLEGCQEENFVEGVREQGIASLVNIAYRFPQEHLLSFIREKGGASYLLPLEQGEEEIKRLESLETLSNIQQLNLYTLYLVHERNEAEEHWKKYKESLLSSSDRDTACYLRCRHLLQQKKDIQKYAEKISPEAPENISSSVAALKERNEKAWEIILGRGFSLTQGEGECCICLDSFDKGVYCPTCKRIVGHYYCCAIWLGNENSCPHCRGKN